MNSNKSPVILGFESECIDVPLDALFPSKVLPKGVGGSVKFRQIRTSIGKLGLVEPIVIFPDKSSSDKFLILDGHLRVSALREIGATHVKCLVSKDDEAYTYNKRVNRLSVIQEHKMIVKAVENGTPIDQLADALGLTLEAIQFRFRLLNGICPEVISLLADKPATRGMFNVLRQMKPFRQIDVSQVMINLNNYSLKLSLAMLHATAVDQLVKKVVPKSQRSVPFETLRRLEQELAAVQADTKLLDESYGPANLQLTIIKTHIKCILDNVNIVKWLARTHQEYLQQLQLIADIKRLPTQQY